MVYHKYVLIPWYPISYLTIAGYGFFLGGAYGSLPDAVIWWCLRTKGGGVLTSNNGIPLWDCWSDEFDYFCTLRMMKFVEVKMT